MTLTVFCKKIFAVFFLRKYLQKLLIIFTYYQKFSDWQKLTENFQYPNFYIFVKLNLFRSLFTIFYIYIVIFDWHAKIFVLFKYWLPLRLNNSWEFVLNYYVIGLCAKFRRTAAHFFFISLILFYFIFLFSKTKIEIDYQNWLATSACLKLNYFCIFSCWIFSVYV